MSEISWKTAKPTETFSESTHKDYNINLNVARRWMTDNYKRYSDVFNVALRDSHSLKESILMFTFTPAMPVPHGRYGEPISLHQDMKTFQIQLSNASQKYGNMVTNYFNAFGKEHDEWLKQCEAIKKKYPQEGKNISKLIKNVANMHKAA